MSSSPALPSESKVLLRQVNMPQCLGTRKLSSCFPSNSHITPAFREEETEAGEVKDLPQVTTHSQGGQLTEQDTAWGSDPCDSAHRPGYTAPLDLRVELCSHVIQAKRGGEGAGNSEPGYTLVSPAHTHRLATATLHKATSL